MSNVSNSGFGMQLLAPSFGAGTGVAPSAQAQTREKAAAWVNLSWHPVALASQADAKKLLQFTEQLDGNRQGQAISLGDAGVPLAMSRLTDKAVIEMFRQNCADPVFMAWFRAGITMRVSFPGENAAARAASIGWQPPAK